MKFATMASAWTAAALFALAGANVSTAGAQSAESGDASAQSPMPSPAQNVLQKAPDDEIVAKLKPLVGTTVFKTGNTELYNDGIQLATYDDYQRRGLKRDFATSNLTPLKIVDVGRFPDNGTMGIKVELPDGTFRYLLGDSQFYRSDSPLPILNELGVWVERSIPKHFSKRTLTSIRNRTIYQGMSVEALYWSWGVPEKTNDYGSGGQQLVYKYGRYVYVSHDVVRDWQIMDE